MIQLVDLYSIKNKQLLVENILDTGKKVIFYIDDRKVSGFISTLDCKWQQERRLYAQPIVDINMSLIDVRFEENERAEQR